VTKDVPYFPCYAANIISSRNFRLMSVAERGLWITIHMECWVNGSAPANPHELARFLSLNDEEVMSNLTERVLSFFSASDGQLTSTELEIVRAGFYARREKQRVGGKKGVMIKKEKQRERGHRAIPLGIHEGEPNGGPEGSLSYIKSDYIKSSSSLEGETTSSEHDGWINDYNDTQREYG
jgi:hypothetical protein